MVQNNSLRKEEMSSVTDPLQHFLKRIMYAALEEYDGKVSKGGRNVTSLWFADDIDAVAVKELMMTNNANNTRREITVKGQKLVTVTSFKYLEAVASSTLNQMYQMMAPNKRFSQGLQITGALQKLFTYAFLHKYSHTHFCMYGNVHFFNLSHFCA